MAVVHGQIGLYGDASGEVGKRGPGLQDGAGVYPHPFRDDWFRVGGTHL